MKVFLEGCLLPPACERACSRIVGGLTLALYTYTQVSNDFWELNVRHL